MLKWLSWKKKEGTQHLNEFQFKIALEIIQELSDDLEYHVTRKYGTTPEYYPDQKRKFDVEMIIVKEARGFLKRHEDMIGNRLDRKLEQLHKISRDL